MNVTECNDDRCYFIRRGLLMSEQGFKDYRLGEETLPGLWIAWDFINLQKFNAR